MKSSISLRGPIARVRCMMAVAGLAAGLLFSFAASAQTDKPGSTTPPAEGSAATTQPQVAQSKEAWSKAMLKLPHPARGCFKSAYPRVEWQQAQCTTAPNHPYPPAVGRRPQTVGNGTDFAAEVTGLMNAAEGTFDSVSGVTSESGNVGGNPPAVANTFSLQLNTKPFTTSVCSPSPNAGCLGWQQFIYSNAGAAFIQYWLLRYNTTCPAGWNTFSFPSSTDTYCWRNGPNAVSVPVQTISNLANMGVSGSAAAGGNDIVTTTVGGNSFSASNNDNMLNLASGWKGAEFIIVGDCCSSAANFNAGSSIVVRTTVHNGTTNAPSCVLEGFTGETNNLNLVGTTAVAMGPSPRIVSNQSNSAGGTAASCAAASGVGDTHLTTFNGLLYDFQASGDFVLAETGPDFLVQTRQISGAPNWPNASINKAVATKMGNTKVAVCTAPIRLEVDGRSASVNDGGLLQLPDGVDISRRGDVYIISDQAGNSVRAAVNTNYIDVSVGLGHWPAKVRGLLANANGNVNEIAMRDGTVLKTPFAFETLYHRYGESWRVPTAESILCNDRRIESGNPTRPFFANDLDPETYRRAREVCIAERVKPGPLLDACTLDVAVIGKDTAAKVFVNARAPVAVGWQGAEKKQ